MKRIIVLLFTIVFTTLKAQNMNQKTLPRDVVTNLFVATDKNEWEIVENCFAKEVYLDYSSMGNSAKYVTPKQIIDIWKTILPGFTCTHHQIGNILEQSTNNQIDLFVYGTAYHFMENEIDNLWIVVGTYNFTLILEDKQWKISKMKFNLKFQNGNSSLAQKAINKVSGITSKLTIGEQNKIKVIAFFKALENKNALEISNLFAENAKHVNPYHSNLFPTVAEGKDEIRKYWEPVFPKFEKLNFLIEEIYTMENPNFIFVKYNGKITLKNNKGIYRNNYYSTFKFNENGSIIEYIEIFNPITAAKFFGLLDKIK